MLEAGKRLDAALLQCDEVVGCLILDVVETHLRSSKPREILVLHQEFHSRYKRMLKYEIRKGIIIQLEIGSYLMLRALSFLLESSNFMRRDKVSELASHGAICGPVT